MFVDLKRQYRKSLKSFDTEENIDLAFYRPIGFAWAYLFRKLGISPNAVTIASIFLGVGAGICFYFNDLWINVMGMLLLIWANSYDSADGQLARMTGNYSRIGRILDGMSGDLWFITIYAAICLRENATDAFFGAHPWLIWCIGLVTGICHAKQAAMADYYRQFHLYFVKGREGSELESADKLRRRLASMPCRGHFWSKLVLFFYTNYTANQEAMTPAMQRLRRELQRRFPAAEPPLTFREAFRRASRPLMKYTNILSFNWRSITLFVSLFLGQPWLYFAAELVIFSAILVYMMVCHERICRTFTRRLENGEY